MADTSLDDFFAKRDRNKKSKSKKFTTSDQIAKKLEESGKKTTEMATKKEKDKTISNVPVSTSIVTPISDQGDDEEWKDFEEEKEKDYSGLKIHNLQIAEPKEEELDRDRSQDLDEDGEPVRPREGNTGPWNKITPSGSIPEPVPQPVIVEEKKEEPQPAVKSSVYRPPHARQSSTPSSGPTQSRGSKGLKSAPEIGSELHFPSLSAAIESSKSGKKGDKGLDSERGFESVKRGSRSNEESVSRGPRLDLGNKFDALSHGEMS